MLISHIHVVGQRMKKGITAQSQAASKPVLRSKNALPKRTSMPDVAAAKALLMVRSTMADASVKTPKILKTNAHKVGYRGAIHALGPVEMPNGELKPSPMAK